MYAMTYWWLRGYTLKMLIGVGPHPHVWDLGRAWIGLYYFWRRGRFLAFVAIDYREVGHKVSCMLVNNVIFHVYLAFKLVITPWASVCVVVVIHVLLQL